MVKLDMSAPGVLELVPPTGLQEWSPECPPDFPTASGVMTPPEMSLSAEVDAGMYGQVAQERTEEPPLASKQVQSIPEMSRTSSVMWVAPPTTPGVMTPSAMSFSAEVDAGMHGQEPPPATKQVQSIPEMSRTSVVMRVAPPTTPSASIVSVIRMQLPGRLVLVAVLVAISCGTAATTVCAYLHAAARSWISEDCSTWPKKYEDFVLGRPLHIIVVDAGIHLVSKVCALMLLLLPIFMARISSLKGIERLCLVLTLQCVAFLEFGLFVCSRIFDSRALDTVSFFTAVLAQMAFVPALLAWRFWRQEHIKRTSTLLGLVAVSLVSIVGSIGIRFGVPLMFLGSVFVFVVCVWVLYCMLSNTSVGDPGEICDLGAQLLLGYFNCWWPILFPQLFLRLMARMSAPPVVQLTIFVGLGVVMKKLFLALADHAVAIHWRGTACFPYLMMEDLIVSLLFMDATPLSIEFFVMLVFVCAWEVVRDAPETKLQLLACVYRLCPSSRSGKKSGHGCVGRTAKKLRAWIEMCFVVIVTALGGSVGSEAVGEVVEEVSDVDGGIKTAAAKVKEEEVKTIIVARIDEARYNMFGELTTSILMICCVVVEGYAQKSSSMDPVLSEGAHVWRITMNYGIMLMGELLTVIVACWLNSRTLRRLGLSLPGIQLSRTAAASMIIALVSAVLNAVLSIYRFRVHFLIEGECPVQA